jgi:hypothetical protein
MTDIQSLRAENAQLRAEVARLQELVRRSGLFFSQRKCRICGGVMDVATGRGSQGLGRRRVDSEICSRACKSRDHRARVREAKLLRGDGMSAAKIAKRLGTKTESVERWLVKAK